MENFKSIEETKEWFRHAKFGMMIHFGLYSLLSGEWQGEVMKDIGEWAQAYFRIPGKEYGKLRDVFNPIFFNADEWVTLAKNAGMEYIVITSKHHEGFALFDSAYDDYNVMHSPFKRDIIGELASACRRHDMRLGLYYSQELDWHEPNGGGYNVGHTNFGTTSWTNDWDYPDNANKNFDQCFNGKIKTQMKEILTKYGEICLIWCDTPFVIRPEQSDELYQLIKSCQPCCLVNSRIGNGKGDYSSMGDNEITYDPKTGRNKNADGLYECPATLNNTWGFKASDQNWKSADEILAIKKRLNDRGINYLLNIGPDALGRLPATAVKVLKELASKR